MIDLNKLCIISLRDAEQRNRNGGNIKPYTDSMLKHCATEVVEATQAYAGYAKWKIAKLDCMGYERQKIEETFSYYENNFASELADIICCVLIIAGKEEINIEKAVLDCIEKNRKRAEGLGDKL